jgi:hypothetical protein
VKSKRQGVIVSGRLHDFAWKEDGVSHSPVVMDCDCMEFISANPVQPKPPDRPDTGGGKPEMPPENKSKT